LFLLELLRFNYFATSRFFATALPLILIGAVSRPVFPQAPRPVPAPW
jgi:hypothetical protein